MEDDWKSPFALKPGDITAGEDRRIIVHTHDGYAYGLHLTEVTPEQLQQIFEEANFIEEVK